MWKHEMLPTKKEFRRQKQTAKKKKILTVTNNTLTTLKRAHQWYTKQTKNILTPNIRYTIGNYTYSKLCGLLCMS